jgi:hypothetical protein
VPLAGNPCTIKIHAKSAEFAAKQPSKNVSFVNRAVPGRMRDGGPSRLDIVHRAVVNQVIVSHIFLKCADKPRNSAILSGLLSWREWRRMSKTSLIYGELCARLCI